MFCLKCGAQNADGFKFCMNCGAELPELAPQATPAPQPEPPAPDAPAADQVPPATAPESQPEPVPQPELPAPDASAPQAAPASPEPPAGFPVPPTPFAAAPQPAQPVPPAPAPQPAQTMPQPVVPEPPQEWPSGAPADPFQSAPSPKGPRTGMIVGIVVGVLAIVAIGVCAFLFMSGTGTPGGQPAQEPPAVQDDGDVADDKGDKDDGDAADDKGGAATGVEVLGSADGTLFDPEFYARDPASLEAALVERGLSLESSTAFHYEDMEDSLYVSYAGRVDEVFPVEGSDDEVNVSIYLEAEDFAFAWENDYASDVVTSLAELPEGSVVCSMDVSFEADAETEDFPALVGAMADALSVSGDVISVSGTSSELVDGACELLGVDEDDCSISISGGMSFDSLAVSYDDGFYLNVTKYGTGDVMANYSFYF